MPEFLDLSPTPPSPEPGGTCSLIRQEWAPSGAALRMMMVKRENSTTLLEPYPGQCNSPMWTQGGREPQDTTPATLRLPHPAPSPAPPRPCPRLGMVLASRFLRSFTLREGCVPLLSTHSNYKCVRIYYNKYRENRRRKNKYRGKKKQR